MTLAWLQVTEQQRGENEGFADTLNMKENKWTGEYQYLG